MPWATPVRIIASACRQAIGALKRTRPADLAVTGFARISALPAQQIL
jgi:hypothetical protein